MCRHWLPLAVTAFQLISAACVAASDAVRCIDTFGRFAEIREVSGDLCGGCSRSVLLVDEQGRSIKLSVGGSSPNIGLTVESGGVVQTCSVPVGSIEDHELVGRIYAFLGARYSFDEVDRWYRDPEGTWAEFPIDNTSLYDRRRGPEDKVKAHGLISLIAVRDRWLRQVEWLNANYSLEEQDEILAAPCGRFADDLRRKAYKLICGVRGGYTLERDSCYTCVERPTN